MLCARYCALRAFLASPAGSGLPSRLPPRRLRAAVALVVGVVAVVVVRALAPRRPRAAVALVVGVVPAAGPLGTACWLRAAVGLGVGYTLSQ